MMLMMVLLSTPMQTAKLYPQPEKSHMAAENYNTMHPKGRIENDNKKY